MVSVITGEPAVPEFTSLDEVNAYAGPFPVLSNVAQTQMRNKLRQLSKRKGTDAVLMAYQSSSREDRWEVEGSCAYRPAMFGGVWLWPARRSDAGGTA